MTRDPLLGIGAQGPGAFLHLGSRPRQGFSLPVELSSLYPGVAFVLKNVQPWVSALFREACSSRHCLLVALIQGGHPFLYPDTSQPSYPSFPEHLALGLLSSWLVVLRGGAAGQEGRDNLALPVIPGRELAYCSVASLYSDAPCGTCLHSQQ